MDCPTFYNFINLIFKNCRNLDKIRTYILLGNHVLNKKYWIISKHLLYKNIQYN